MVIHCTKNKPIIQAHVQEEVSNMYLEFSSIWSNLQQLINRLDEALVMMITHALDILIMLANASLQQLEKGSLLWLVIHSPVDNTNTQVQLCETRHWQVETKKYPWQKMLEFLHCLLSIMFGPYPDTSHSSRPKASMEEGSYHPLEDCFHLSPHSLVPHSSGQRRLAVDFQP